MCKNNHNDDDAPPPLIFNSWSQEEEEEEVEEEESDEEIVSDLKPGDQLNPLTLEKSLEKFDESIYNAIGYVGDTEGLGRSCFHLLEFVESIYDCFHQIDKRWEKVGDSKGFSLRPSTLEELTFDQLQTFALDLLTNEVSLYYDALLQFLEPFPLSAAREKQLEKLRLAINYYGLQLGPASYNTSSDDDDADDAEEDDDDDVVDDNDDA